jgi:hypothetical protein
VAAVLRLLAALLACCRALNDSQNLIFAHDQQLFVVDLDFRATVLTKKDPIAGTYIEGLACTVFSVLAFPHSDDFTFLWLLFGGVRDDDPAPNLLPLFNSAYDNAVLKRFNIDCHTAQMLLPLLWFG